jgi:hypothetical protein
MTTLKSSTKTKKGSGAIKNVGAIELSGSKRLNLDYKDINFISVISQKTNIPRNKLVSFMETQNVSKDARDIAMMILGKNSSAAGVRAVERKQQIAKHYKDWVAEISGAPVSVKPITSVSKKSVKKPVSKRK